MYLLNRLPSTKTPNNTPFQLLHNKPPTCTDLKVFGCLCYPNISATTPYKLSPRSVPCVFLGYPSSHKAYRCFNMVTQKLIISRHVIFDRIMVPSISGTPMAMEWHPTQYLHHPTMTASLWHLAQCARSHHHLQLATMTRARGYITGSRTNLQQCSFPWNQCSAWHCSYACYCTNSCFKETLQAQQS
jgi:hypothetical protein